VTLEAPAQVGCLEGSAHFNEERIQDTKGFVSLSSTM
jgi:hypothetical protein